MQEFQPVPPKISQKCVLKTKTPSNFFNSHTIINSNKLSYVKQRPQSTQQVKRSKSISSRHQFKSKKQKFSICSSNAVCAFAPKENPNLKNCIKIGLFPKQQYKLMNDEVFLSSNSPNSINRRRYRILPKSSHGFRQFIGLKGKRGMQTEQSKKIQISSWESYGENIDFQEIWKN